MIIVVRVGGKLTLAQYRPRLFHVDALIRDVEGVEEQVVAMRDRATEQRGQQQDAIKHAPTAARTACTLLGAQPDPPSARRSMGPHRSIFSGLHCFLLTGAL